MKETLKMINSYEPYLQWGRAKQATLKTFFTMIFVCGFMYLTAKGPKPSQISSNSILA